ncbi:hypothetical protein FH972_014735 [Carpinus fangiana]|uniref:Uncharacterized protein n=1 Tax=Carpinus fangiana TaxID=176857 RepID=A0A5N6RAZ3_9ROSI|nr:hypothetical protein FH972_014735 [Carpinus fangiana]
MAVDLLVWEASCRQKDPVLGPYGEYRKVFDELNMYRPKPKSVDAIARAMG